MPPVPTLPMETIERARDLYRDGARVRDICAATGMSVGALYYHLDGAQPARRRGAAPAAPARGGGECAEADALARAPEARGAALPRGRAAGAKTRIRARLRLPAQGGPRDDLAALRELTRILRDLAAVETQAARAEAFERGGAAMEREEALAVEGRAVLVRRERRG